MVGTWDPPSPPIPAWTARVSIRESEGSIGRQKQNLSPSASWVEDRWPTMRFIKDPAEKVEKMMPQSKKIEGAADASAPLARPAPLRSEEHTSELQSRPHLVCRLLLEKKKQTRK